MLLPTAYLTSSGWFWWKNTHSPVRWLLCQSHSSPALAQGVRGILPFRVITAQNYVLAEAASHDEMIYYHQQLASHFQGHRTHPTIQQLNEGLRVLTAQPPPLVPLAPVASAEVSSPHPSSIVVEPTKSLLVIDNLVLQGLISPISSTENHDPTFEHLVIKLYGMNLQNLRHYRDTSLSADDLPLEIRQTLIPLVNQRIAELTIAVVDELSLDQLLCERNDALRSTDPLRRALLLPLLEQTIVQRSRDHYDSIESAEDLWATKIHLLREGDPALLQMLLPHLNARLHVLFMNYLRWETCSDQFEFLRSRIIQMNETLGSAADKQTEASALLMIDLFKERATQQLIQKQTSDPSIPSSSSTGATEPVRNVSEVSAIPIPAPPPVLPPSPSTSSNSQMRTSFTESIVDPQRPKLRQTFLLEVSEMYWSEFTELPTDEGWGDTSSPIRSQSFLDIALEKISPSWQPVCGLVGFDGYHRMVVFRDAQTKDYVGFAGFYRGSTPNEMIIDSIGAWIEPLEDLLRSMILRLQKDFATMSQCRMQSAQLLDGKTSKFDHIVRICVNPDSPRSLFNTLKALNYESENHQDQVVFTRSVSATYCWIDPLASLGIRFLSRRESIDGIH